MVKFLSKKIKHKGNLFSLSSLEKKYLEKVRKERQERFFMDDVELPLKRFTFCM